MKVLIVSEMSVPYAVGGGEVRYALLARQLVRRGHEVTWLSMRQRNSPDEESVEGVWHIHRGPRIENPPGRTIPAMVRFMFTVLAHILTHRYDIIDAQTYAPLPAVWLACLLSRQRMVATIHSTIHDVARDGGGRRVTNPLRSLSGLAEKFLYNLPYSKIIAVSDSTAETLVQRWGVSRTRIHVVTNGIELPPDDDVVGSPDRPIDLVYAGRFVSIKNVDDLIRVVASCHAAGAVARAVFIGDGPLLNAMALRAKADGLSSVIEFTGRKTNAEVLEIMRQAKVYIHASSLEGFPVVLVEALACRLPVVAYRIPGVVDVIEDAVTGILVEERNTLAHAAACIQLLSSPERRERMAAAGRQTVEDSLTLDKMTDRVLGVYRHFDGQKLGGRSAGK